MLRFAILKEVAGGGDAGGVVLEYSETQVLERLQARIRENLSAIEKPVTKKGWFGEETVVGIKREWTLNEVLSSQEKAFQDLVSEFKEKTVAIR